MNIIEDIKQVRKLFSSIDNNSDGVISAAEMKIYVEQNVKTRDQYEINKDVKKIMDMCDGDMSFNEFYSLTMSAAGVCIVRSCDSSKHLLQENIIEKLEDLFSRTIPSWIQRSPQTIKPVSTISNL